MKTVKISVALFAFVIMPLAVYCQRDEALERLYSISDEVLIVRVTHEQSGQHSALDCSSYVDAEIVEKFKSRNIAKDSSVVHFIRPIECDENVKPSEDVLEKGHPHYIVFLSSANPATRFPPRREFFYLSDTGLGLQLESKHLVGYIRMLAKREKKN